MAQNETDYKKGDWIKHKYTGELFVIYRVLRKNSTGYVKIMGMDLNTNTLAWPMKFRTYSIDKFNKRFKIAAAAQILYGNKCKEVTI